jgi:hypothetical protein
VAPSESGGQSFLGNVVAGFPHSRAWNDLGIGCGTHRLQLIGEIVSGDDGRLHPAQICALVQKE